MWGAPPEEISAYTPLDSLSVFNYRHFNPFNKNLFFPVMNAPSSEAVFKPWQAFLQEKGVEFCFNQKLIEIKTTEDGNKITSLIFQKEKTTHQIEADYFILATPVEKVAALLPEILHKKMPIFAKLTKFVYPFNGIQLYLKDEFTLSKGITRFEDSPWDVHASYQDSELWPDVYLKPPVTAIFSTIVANWEEPGIVYKKPITECSPDEIVDELVAQIIQHQGMKLERFNIHAFHIDNAIKFSADNSKIIAIENKLYVTPAKMHQKEPKTKTPISNLFLAGDYVSTPMHRGSMESANISGKLAANAIMDAIGVSDNICPILSNAYHRK